MPTAEWGADMTRKIVGAAALALLTAACGTSSGGTSAGSTAASTRPPAAAAPHVANAETLMISRGAVSQIQSNLQAQNFYHGPIDGIIGPKTRAALADYQQSQGLPRTAVLDQRTLQTLMAANPPAAASGSSAKSGTSAAKMSADQVRGALQAQGYADISDIAPHGDRDYTAKATKNGKTETLEIDGQSGKIMSAQ